MQIPPIERDDFPAPPFPYAVESLKRRLSCSSIEDDNDQDDEDIGEFCAVVLRRVQSVLITSKISDEADCARVNKINIATAEVKKLENESSIAHAIATDLEEKSKKVRGDYIKRSTAI